MWCPLTAALRWWWPSGSSGRTWLPKRFSRTASLSFSGSAVGMYTARSQGWLVSGMNVAVMTTPRGGSVRSVAYGSADDSADPWTSSSGWNGTFDAIAIAGVVAVARALDWSAYQPGSGRNPSPTGPRA